MKAIMISIKPKWVAKILNGEKTIEIRKTMPKCDLPIDVYIYCTKDKNRLVYNEFNNYFAIDNEHYAYGDEDINGKVVAKFTLNKIDEHHVLPTERILPFNWNVEQKLEQLCLTKEEVMAYGNGEDYQAFLWHIDNLVIFDEPKELDEFKKPTKYCNKDCSNCDFAGFNNKTQKWEFECSITKAPQNFCYVEE